MKKNPRRSNILGLYATDRFLITLGAKVAYVNRDTLEPRKLDQDRISVLFHEYIHYLQNIATAAGYHSFRRALDGWRLFRETVIADGTSEGSMVLAPDRSKWISEYIAIGNAFDGDVGGDLPETFIVERFDIEKIDEKFGQLPIGTFMSGVTTVTVEGSAHDSAGVSMKYRYRFGASALMEGMAYELDQIVAQGVSGRRRPRYPSPPFPYQVLRRLVTHFLPGADTRSILKIGCLALLSNDQAGALMSVCRIVGGNVTQGASVEEAIRRVDVTPMHALSDAIVAVDIPDHDRAFQGGTLGRGIAYIHKLYRESLFARKSEPFLDLWAVNDDGNVDFEGINRLLSRVRPCMVLQQGPGRESKLGRDILWLNGNDANLVRDELAVLHCALHFMISHVALDFIAPTTLAGSHACPFYTCCTLPLRTRSPVICKRRPWRSNQWSGWATEKRCWYAAAVASSIGSGGASSASLP